MLVKRWTFSVYPCKKLYPRYKYTQYNIVLTVAPHFLYNFVVYQNGENHHAQKRLDHTNLTTNQPRDTFHKQYVMVF